MNHILFVDDEPKVLDGLRRMLRSLRNEWNMEFAEAGAVALERMAAVPFDVVVTDMRMPGMDGASLLTEVMRLSPDSVRIILSGQCDRPTVLKTVGLAHQFLTKPCDSESLKTILARACALRDKLPDARQKQTVSRLQCVRSVPESYTALCRELDSPNAAIGRVSEVIAADVGMTARIMQLISTGFFGTPQRCSDPYRAATLFDLETLRTLAASASGIAPLPDEAPLLPVARDFNEHSVAVAKLASEIARATTSDEVLIDDAHLAGLLHDVGVFVMAQEDEQRYREALAEPGFGRLPLWEAERLACHASHAEVGGYLTGLWGLPDTVVRAVAYHHSPGLSRDAEFLPLTAVYVADMLVTRAKGTVGGQAKFDQEYLRRVGVQDRLPEWAALYQELRSEVGCS